MAEALATSSHKDNARGLVTMGELGQFKRSSGSGVAKVQRGIEREEALSSPRRKRNTEIVRKRK